jgi:hypothetical protein
MEFDIFYILLAVAPFLDWMNSSKEIKEITKLNSVALVREQTILTERPPPVGEVSANFCG